MHTRVHITTQGNAFRYLMRLFRVPCVPQHTRCFLCTGFAALFVSSPINNLARRRSNIQNVFGKVRTAVIVRIVCRLRNRPSAQQSACICNIPDVVFQISFMGHFRSTMHARCEIWILSCLQMSQTYYNTTLPGTYVQPRFSQTT